MPDFDWEWMNRQVFAEGYEMEEADEPASRNAMAPPPSSDPADLLAEEEPDARKTTEGEPPDFEGEPGPYADGLDTPIKVCAPLFLESAEGWNALDAKSKELLLELRKAWTTLDAKSKELLLEIARVWPTLGPRQRATLVDIAVGCSKVPPGGFVSILNRPAR